MDETTKPLRPAKRGHAKKAKEKVNSMAEEKEKLFANLDVTFQMKQKNGVLVTVSAKCSTWDSMQKFLSDFENTLLNGNNGKPQH